jgi:hypothetical protein
MKRKRKIFQSREEYRAWLAEREAHERLLRDRIALVQAELASAKKT